MTRTIRVGYPPVVRIVPVSEVVMTEMLDGEPRVYLRSEFARGDDHSWPVDGITTEAELLAALGWSPPPDPTARTLLDTLRHLHVDGELTAFYGTGGTGAVLGHDVSEWAAAGYPGARRQP